MRLEKIVPDTNIFVSGFINSFTFNTDLLSEPASFRTEVVVHELLHLKVPNHGKVFNALLKAHLSDGDATHKKNKHEDG